MSKLRQLIEAANRKCEMAWKVYSYNPEKDNELVDTSKAFDCIAAAQAHKRDILEKNPNYTVEIIAESSQKNEDFYKYIDDVPTREIAKALKELGIKEPYATQKAKIADKLAKRFGLRSVPTPIEMTSVLDALPYFTEESAQKLTYNDIGIGDKYKLSNGKVLQVYDMGPDYIRVKINGQLQSEQSPEDFDSLKLVGVDMSESTQKSESKVNMPKLKNEVQAAVNKYFKDDKDLLEYVYIDTKKDKLGRDILEVRAELGYNNMVKLADYLDKIVTKYDKYAYFDQETSGIMTAVFESAQKNEDLSKHPKLQEIWSRWKFNTKYGLHYTSNAKDTQAYLAKITKPNTFWLEDEDTGKAIVQGTPKDLINFMLSHKDTVEESAQKNESLRDLNLELADDTNAIAASADKIRQRFEYRTLQNQSYDEKQAEKIYLEVRRELEKAKKMIDACYNKIG